MVRPFVPFSADDSRKELRSLMVVSSEPKTYGKITVYDIKTPLPSGPATVSAQFESEPAISQTITPLDQLREQGDASPSDEYSRAKVQ